MKKWNRLFAMFCLITLLVSGTVTASAAAPEEQQGGAQIAAASEDTGIVPYSDTIVTRYRVGPKGNMQYRRWNETKNVWVDPYWIDMP